MIKHPTAEQVQVQEDQSTEAVRSANEVIEVSLEQEWEEFVRIMILQTKLVRSGGVARSQFPNTGRNTTRSNG